jgi:hypothetical protein
LAQEVVLAFLALEVLMVLIQFSPQSPQQVAAAVQQIQ